MPVQTHRGGVVGQFAVHEGIELVDRGAHHVERGQGAGTADQAVQVPAGVGAVVVACGVNSVTDDDQAVARLEPEIVRREPGAFEHAQRVVGRQPYLGRFAVANQDQDRRSGVHGGDPAGGQFDVQQQDRDMLLTPVVSEQGVVGQARLIDDTEAVSTRRALRNALVANVDSAAAATPSPMPLSTAMVQAVDVDRPVEGVAAHGVGGSS